MSGFEQGPAGHRRAWELIPWVVNGRASDSERTLVEAHVRECRDCRAELAFQREVQQALVEEPSNDVASRPAFEELWSRIDRGAAASRSSRVLRWLAVAVVIEAIGLAALSFQVWRESRDEAPYRTLSLPSSSPPAAILRLVPAPELRLSELQALLDREGLQIVGGPSEAGVYTLASRNAAQDVTASALQRLRAHPGVRFAEPIVADDRP